MVVRYGGRHGAGERRKSRVQRLYSGGEVEGGRRKEEEGEGKAARMAKYWCCVSFGIVLHSNDDVAGACLAGRGNPAAVPGINTICFGARHWMFRARTLQIYILLGRVTPSHCLEAAVQIRRHPPGVLDGDAPQSRRRHIQRSSRGLPRSPNRSRIAAAATGDRAGLRHSL